ncbi:MAG: DUF983 domain-containing protein [Alphaproteobacteria bacterium]|nr:DUF983 domain-containing protein [Alphaproteobacteria bacterium]
MTNSVSVTLSRAVGRGLSCSCPRCGRGNIFARYLKPAATCSSCGEPYGEIRTDDIAPYFTILVVGHLIVPLVLMVEQLYAPPTWIHWALWPPLTLLCAFIALPRIKGAVMGWMWWLGIRGDEQH